MTADQRLDERLQRFRAASSRGANVTDDLLAIQASLARRLHHRILEEEAPAIALSSSTGTGKTVIALVGAMQATEDHGKIDRICMLAPNQVVRSSWLDTARMLVPGDKLRLVEEPRKPRKHEISALTVGQLSTKDVGQLPGATLVILDEAHRGTGSLEGRTYQRLTRVCRDRAVVLVTATPYQLSTSGLVAMLSLNASHQRNQELRHVQEYARQLGRLLVRGPEAPVSEHQMQRVVDTAARAVEVVNHHLLDVPPGTFPNTAYRPDDSSVVSVGLPDAPDARTLGWAGAYWTARAVPEALGKRIGDSFNRGLDSSCEAFWASSVGAALRKDRRRALRSLNKELSARLGTGRSHPKVNSTVDWAVSRSLEPRHVLVFAHFLATRDALAAAVRDTLQIHHPDHDVEVAAPTGSSIPDRLVTRLRTPAGSRNPPVVLILTERFSESITLDGGRPCIVHHDLPWNPNRLRQRMGRVTRISSGFQPVDSRDVHIPVLDVPTDSRLYETIRKRLQLGDQLIPAELDASYPDLPEQIAEKLQAVTNYNPD